MAYITTGLTNGGLTTHYQIKYDDSLSAADGKNRANALIGSGSDVCEADFTLMTNWFGGITLPYTIPYEVDIAAGGAWSGSWGSGPPVTLTPGNGSPLDLVRFILVAEVTEMFMLQSGLGWSPNADNEGSAGEGLSHFLATQLLISIGSSLRPSSIANLWLNSPRADFVNNVDFEDNANDPKTGCAVLFLWYLNTQLAFDVTTIVGAGAQELAGVYKNLTGDTNDPFPYFKALLDAAFPSQTSSAVPGPNQDDPWPLGSFYFVVDKSTFGRDEVQDVINTGGGLFPKAFWLVLEGFNVQALASAVPALSGAATSFMSITPNGSGPELEIPSNTKIPQRIRFPFDVTFSSVGSFPSTGGSPLEEPLGASITVRGATFTTSTTFELIAGADPYFTNVDPSQDNVSWLSQDLRVFTTLPALVPTPIAGGPTFTGDSFAAAYTYIQQLITYLNNNYSNPSGTDPFDTNHGILPQQSDAYSADSSVTPATIIGFSAFNNYNFAVARVRLRGSSGTTGEASNVKVFFRLWVTQSADTDYDTSSTYTSHTDSAGLPDWPLVAPGNHTIPFFATGNNPSLSNPSNPEYGASGINNQTIEITTADSRWAYFGCFLNVYDPSNTVGGAPVLSLLTGTHHCIVAQIAYDDAPIVNANGITMSPGNSDKLAQRNLQVTASDNPGPAATHRVPQTFDLRPSGSAAAPDELMIDWGATPVGTTASLYWPQVDAASVVSLASRLYATHLLSTADVHTLRCRVAPGVTYVPIPPGVNENIASLLTVDLPSTVTTGEEYNVIVRRISYRTREEIFSKKIDVHKELQAKAHHKKTHAPAATPGHVIEATPPSTLEPTKIDRFTPDWRYVVGTFQVKIPVSTAEKMLLPDENTLAIFKWRLQRTASTNRWYPVLARYIEYLSARIDGLGGKAGGIVPSPHGVPVPHHRRGEHELTGKVAEVLYDCFGDFEGFVLETCSGCHEFKSRERGVERVVLRACRERLRLSVFLHGHAIHRLVILGG